MLWMVAAFVPKIKLSAKQGGIFLISGMPMGFILSGSVLASGVLKSGIPIHPIYKSAIMTSGATIVVFVLMPPAFLFNEALAKGLINYGIFTGLFGSVIPPILFNIGTPKVRSLGNILSASELPMAVLMSTLVLRETVHYSQWIGILFILIGIVYPNLEKNRLSSTYLAQEKS